MDQSGVLLVIKSHKSENDLLQSILELSDTEIGSITPIWSKGQQTTNYVVIVTSNLYMSIHSNLSKIGAQSATPYLIDDNHIPKETQCKDIFMRFEYTTHPSKISPNKLMTSIRDFILLLDRYSVCNIPEFSVEIPSNDNIIPRKPMDFGFIRFKDECPLDIAVYVKSILNGHSFDTPYTFKVKAYWCERQDKKYIT